MSTHLPIGKKEIIRDAYTERLLSVCYELVKRQALAKRKDFADAIIVSSSFLVGIEGRQSNYPKTVDKRAKAETNLLHQFYVNPDYIKGTSDQMFVKEPPKVKQEVGEDAVKLNFRDKKVKKDLLQELEETRARISYLESLLKKEQIHYEEGVYTDIEQDDTKVINQQHLLTQAAEDQQVYTADPSQPYGDREASSQDPDKHPDKTNE